MNEVNQPECTCNFGLIPIDKEASSLSMLWSSILSQLHRSINTVSLILLSSTLKRKSHTVTLPASRPLLSPPHRTLADFLAVPRLLTFFLVCMKQRNKLTTVTKNEKKTAHTMKAQFETVVVSAQLANQIARLCYDSVYLRSVLVGNHGPV